MWDNVNRPQSWGRSLVATLLCVMVVAACTPTGPTRLKMKFDVSRKANDDQPLNVDVVVSYDPEVVDELDRLTAAEWFQQRDQRLRNNPGQQTFSSWRWELTPGLEVPSIELKLPGLPAQGLLFADYLSRGKHSARFDPRYAQTVQFRHDAFRVLAGKLNEPDTGGWRPPVGWTTVGVGGVGIGLGIMFSVFATNAAAESAGLRPIERERHRQLQEDIDDYNLGQIISYSVGAGLIVTGLLILFWPDSDDSPFRDIPDSDDGGSASVGGLLPTLGAGGMPVFRW